MNYCNKNYESNYGSKSKLGRLYYNTCKQKKDTKQLLCIKQTNMCFPPNETNGNKSYWVKVQGRGIQPHSLRLKIPLRVSLSPALSERARRPLTRYPSSCSF